MLKIKREFERKENFPTDGEAYAVGQAENGKYFFAWGSEIPYSKEVPFENVINGDDGIEFFDTLEKAMKQFQITVEAWNN